MTNTYVKPDSPLRELSADETCGVVSHDPVCCNRMQRAFSDPPSKEITLQAKTFTYSPGLGRQEEAPMNENFSFPIILQWVKGSTRHSLGSATSRTILAHLLPAVTRAWLHFALPPPIIKRKQHLNITPQTLYDTITWNHILPLRLPLIFPDVKVLHSWRTGAEPLWVLLTLLLLVRLSALCLTCRSLLDLKHFPSGRTCKN